MKKFLKFIFFCVIPIALLAVGIWFAVRFHNRKNLSAQMVAADVDRTFVVKRGEMTLGLRLNGNVVANKKHKIGLEASYSTKILDIVDENTHVKEGDLLVTFEETELQERIDELSTNLSNTEEELTVAEENVKIQERSNAVTLREAEDSVKQAASALRKYLRLTRSEKRDSYDLGIMNAETSLKTAEKNYSDKKDEISKTSASDESERASNEQALSKLQDAISSAENSLQTARNNRKSFKRYDDPIQKMTLNNNLEHSILNLEKARISTSSSLLQAKKRVDNLTANRRRIATQLTRYQSYLPMMKIYAPTDGIVIYGDPDSRYTADEIKPGTDAHKGMILLTIPEMSNLMVDFDLPEAFRSKINPGNKVIITPESIPTLKVGGSISEIATLPVNQFFWDDTSPKIYPSRITLDSQDDQLVNGMSVLIEIISSVLQDVLYIPVEAVFENDKGFYVYVNKDGVPAEIPVKIGDSNDNTVCITEGVSEGDIVYLYRPYQKKQTEE